MQFSTLITLVAVAISSPVPALAEQIASVAGAVGASLVVSSLVGKAIYSHEANLDAKKREKEMQKMAQFQ